MTSRLGDPLLDLVQQSLMTVGYDERAIVLDYDFASSSNGNGLDQVDLAAFSDPVRHDLQTSCIAAQRVDARSDASSIVRSLSHLATPLALLLRPQGIEIWPVTADAGSNPQAFVPYDRVQSYFVEHSQDLRPDAITTAKTKGQQLTFFDIDRALLSFAYESTQSLLVERFESAVGAARQSLLQKSKEESGSLTRSALQILAAAILQDKHLLGEEKSNDVNNLIDRAASKFGQYFAQDAFRQIGHDVAQLTLDTLRRGVTFRSFTNEMLGYFYENAFVDPQIRRDLGVYYTPRPIAQRILARLPVEDIQPSQRVVFDGSSGSGNLLLAAFERIGGLLPAKWSQSRQHAYLVQRIHGVDVDPFATQVAGLSLFFMALPMGDAWNIKTADFIRSNSPSLPNPPTILVGNPPFKEERSNQGKRVQLASQFLSKYLDILPPDGLLGVILPETFIENSSCRDVRRRLLNDCDILEMWHLPEGLFPMSDVATVTLLAKKHSRKSNVSEGPVRVEKVGALQHERVSFLNGGDPRFSYIVRSPNAWLQNSDHQVSSSPLDDSVWSRISFQKRLRDVANVRNGIIPGRTQRATHISMHKQSEEWRPWLPGAGKVDPYSMLSRPDRYIRYPGNLQWPRTDLESTFALPRSKVLVNSARAPGNPWRVYAAVDDLGYFPSQSFHCVIPKDSTVTLEEITAYLNSSLASAWVDAHNRRRWIAEDTLKDMPFPLFSPGNQRKIIDLVWEISALKKSAYASSSNHSRHSETLRTLVLTVDDLVYEAFQITEQGRSLLAKYFSGYRRPGREWNGFARPVEEYPSGSFERARVVTGEVLGLDTENNTILLWLRGLNENEPIQLPIPESMPGWALRLEAAFEAELPGISSYSDHLRPNDLRNFRPLDFAFALPEQLQEILAHPQRLDDLYDL